MATRESIRPGGRSARVQASVHKAVRDLLAEVDRTDLTVPMVAARAGVTPSTIYRRWGDLQELLADVAVERLRADAGPQDTGSTRGDLEAWVEQYVDEMSSEVGRTMIRDVLANYDPRNAEQCFAFTRGQIEVISERAAARGEAPLDCEAVMDHVIAPIMYRIHFGPGAPPGAYWRGLLDRLWKERG